MKTKLKTRSQSRPAELIVYMEVYSSNRVVYRVTAGSIVPAAHLWNHAGGLVHRRTPEHSRLFRQFGTDDPLCQ